MKNPSYTTLTDVAINNATDWIRSHRETFQAMDPWQKRAYLYCISGLTPDEKKAFINRWRYDRPVESTLAKWSKSHAAVP